MQRESLLVLAVGYGYSSDKKLAYTRIFCANISVEAKKYQKYYFLDKQTPCTLPAFEIIDKPFFYNLVSESDYTQLNITRKLAFGEISLQEANYIHHRKDITRVIENQPLNNIYQVAAPYNAGRYDISGISIVAGFNSYKICHSESEFKQAIAGKILGNVELVGDKITLPDNILCSSLLPEQAFSKTIRLASSQDLFALNCSSLGTAPLALSILAGLQIPQLAIPDAVKYLKITKPVIRAISCPSVMHSCIAFLNEITNFASPTVCAYFKLDASSSSGISLPARLLPLFFYKTTRFFLKAKNLNLCLDQSQYYKMSTNYVIVGDLDPSSKIALAENTSITCNSMSSLELKNTGTASGEFALAVYKFKQSEILIQDNFDSLTLSVDNTLYPSEDIVSLTLRVEGCIETLTLWSNVNSDNLDLIILGSGRICNLVIRKVSHSVGCYIPVGTVDARLALGNTFNTDVSFAISDVPSFILVRYVDADLAYNVAYRLSLDRDYKLSPRAVARIGMHTSIPLVELRKKYPIKALVPALYLD